MQIVDLRVDPIRQMDIQHFLYQPDLPHADVGGYLPFVVDHHLIGHFLPWLSWFKLELCRKNFLIYMDATRSHKRLRRNSNNAADAIASSDNSNNTDDGIQDLENQLVLYVKNHTPAWTGKLS